MANWWDSDAPQRQGGELMSDAVPPRRSGEFWSGDPPAQEGGPVGVEGIGYSSGATFPVRAGLSMKDTPEGQRGFLESVYGEGNVRWRGDDIGWTYVDQGGREQAVDEFGLDIGDAADLAGSVVTAAPTLAVTSGNPLLMGLASGGGALLKKVIGSMLPGQDSTTLAEDARDVGVSALMGGAAQAGINRAAPVMDRFRPRNVVAGNVQRSMQTPYAQRGRQISKETGIPFTPGQETGSRAQLTVEGMLRRHPASADIVATSDLAASRAAESRLASLMKSISDKPASAESSGFAVWSAYDDAVSSAIKARRAQAKIDFGAVDEASKGASRIQLQNVQATIDDIVTRYDVPGGGDASAALVGRLKKLKTELGDATNPQQVQRLLEVYGSAARGKDKLFLDLDTAQQRGIAGQLFGALNRDLDDAAEAAIAADSITAGTGGGAMEGSKAARALVAARDNYRAMSAKIDELGDTVIGRMFNGNTPAPEAVAGKFFTMHPTEIRGVISVLQRQNPEAVAQVRRYAIQKALDDSATTSANAATQGAMFSPRKFNTFMQQNEKRLVELFDGDREALRQLRTINEGLGRLADRANTDGSPTAPLLFAFDMARGLFMTPVRGAINVGANVLGPREMAKVMTTPEGRQALVTMVSTTANQKSRAASATLLTSLIAADDTPPPPSPNEPAADAEQASQ